ncbi:MAG: translation initiation factor [Bacteroidales bacterium]|nr:translation initiation factor [Bacteroidales bacterium]
MAKDWKDRLGIVYSTDPDFKYEKPIEDEQETLPKKEQNLMVITDRKQRKGKTVTIIQGYIGTKEDLKKLGKLLKSKCGVGGSEKDNEIIIQGDFVSKVKEILKNDGYKVK